MIDFKTGEILAEHTKALANTVKCMGFMGRGIAFRFKKAGSENFSQ